jgi:PAS domain S-box-containing protein
MEIWEKTIAGLIAIFVVITIILLLLSQTIFLDSYRKIESADVTNDVNAILSNIHDEFGNLESSASDYGGWNDTYQFVNGDNPAYVTDNLVNSTYDGLHLNFIVITNTSNTIVYGQSFNLTDHRISPLPRDLGQALVTAPALQNLANATPVYGFLVAPHMTALVAASPILHSDLSGPPVGTLIMGRYLDDAEIKSFGLPSRSPPTFSTTNPPVAPSPQPSAAPEGNEPVVDVSPVSEEIVNGNTTIADINGNTALTLSIQEPRDYYLQGKQTIQTFLGILLVLMLALGIFILFIIDRLILSRLYRIMADTRAVSDGTASRIRKKGDDEISQLADAMNQMLEQLEQSHTLLKKSEEHFRTIIYSMQLGILIIDAKTHIILDVNTKALEMLGSDKDHIVGSVCHRFICPAESGRCPVIDFGLDIDTSERVLLNAQGNKIAIIKTVIRTLLGGKDVLIESFIDISERKLMEEELRKSNKKLNLLSGITRHDLNNQLHILNAFLEMSKKSLNDAAKISEFITREEQIARTMGLQIAFTKEYEAIGVTAPVWQNCRTLVDTAAHQVPNGKITVKNDLEAGAEVFADPLVIKVFYNLIENAIQYGEKITTLRFFAEVHDGDQIIVCEDNGMGIPVDEKEQIFERGSGKNTGMGLFLAREILTITGITIQETGEPGKGARFEMTVPKDAYRIANTVKK